MSGIHITSGTHTTEVDTHTGKQVHAALMTRWLALKIGEINNCRQGNSTTITSTAGEKIVCTDLIGKSVYKVQGSDDGLGTGAIVGIIIGGLVAILIIYFAIRCAISRKKQKTTAINSNENFDQKYQLSDFPPNGSEISSWLNASSDESQRALAYQKQFPPPEHPAALPHELSQIAEKGLDAFAFISLDPNWVQVDRDI
ncbi:hypothetical protein HK096_000699, partial [Nowakowskiella sp. JEL0078]